MYTHHSKQPSDSSYKISEYKNMLDNFGTSVFGSSASGSVLGISKTVKPANDINKISSFNYMSPTANS